MTAATALAAFTAIESDIVGKAIAWGRSLTCAIAIRADDGMLGIVKIHSSILGMLTFTDIDGNAVPRERFVELYVTPYVQRLEAIHQARKLERAARENIRNYFRSRRRIFCAERAGSVPSTVVLPRGDRQPIAGKPFSVTAKNLSMVTSKGIDIPMIRSAARNITANVEWMALDPALKSMLARRMRRWN